jgi:hypothetical protein
MLRLDVGPLYERGKQILSAVLQING